MALNSINTNIAAIAAQGNIRTASNNASSSIARLSSGNRIVQASDDVASMSVGTSLRTQVNTLRTVLMNTAQGSSMLEVANGALEQITDILVRQKELTVQAGSGSISNTERAFLNQEFQHLTSEIDRLVDSTNFNGVKLLDGTLSKSVTAVSNANSVSTAATAAYTASVIGTVDAGNIVNGDFFVFNGVRMEFTTSAAGTAQAAGKISIVAGDNDATAENIAAFLNQSTDARLANFNFFTTANGADVHASYSGGAMNANIVVDAVDGVTAAAGIVLANTVTFTAAGTIEDGLGSTSYDVVGDIQGSTFLTRNAVNLSGIAAATNTAANQGIQNNAAFIGDVLKNLEITSGGANDTLNFRLAVGDIVYSATAVDVTNANDTDVTLVGNHAVTGAVEGGRFRIRIAGGSFTAAAVAGTGYTAQQASEFQTEFRQTLSELSVRQNRNIRSFNDADAVVMVNGVEVANLTNMRANFVSSDFTAVNIEDVRVTKPEPGSTDAKIEVKVNGEWYQSYTGIGSLIEINTVIGLQNLTDPSKSLTLTTGTVAIPTGTNIALDVSTENNAKAVQEALLKAFGVTEGRSAAQFQMGVSATDTIGVEMSSVDSATIFQGKTLDILTSGNATIAGTQLDTAINMVKKVHADVGGFQARFNYATANTESAIANQDAARGVFLDTDVAAESTAFATAQVQLQAGISVLAQANLMPQNLLKLIG